jgi:poly-gamma-glutamate synthesis protein (capsule biosynthesis protein)
MNKHLKYFIPILFALAILFGLVQRKYDPYVGYKKTTFFAKQNLANDKSFKDYLTQSEQLARKDNAKTSASFLAVGDIMLSRNVAAAIKKADNPLLPFEKTADVFKAVDFSFGNLESPFSGSDYFNSSGSMVFNAPRNNIKGLVDNKFKVLSLANNHALDQETKGLEYTIKYLDDNNIQYIGAGKNKDEAWQPAIIDTSGIKICFIGASYASINDNGKTTNDFVARIDDITGLKSAMRNAQSACNFIIVTMHAGTEYTRKPNQAQIDFARAAIDAGADMVIGSHPHWIQTMEKYNGKYIFYSLGNFIFDQMWSVDTKEGLVLKIKISKSKLQNPTAPQAANLDDLQGTRIPATLESIELIPVIIENYSTPRPANDEEAIRILQKINQAEKKLYP